MLLYSSSGLCWLWLYTPVSSYISQFLENRLISASTVRKSLKLKTDSFKSTFESWLYLWTLLVKSVLNGISNEISSRQCTTEKCLITSLSSSSVLYGWVLEVATPRMAIGSGLQWGHLNCLKAESWSTRDTADQKGPECPVWACKQVLAVIGVHQWAGILLG